MSIIILAYYNAAYHSPVSFAFANVENKASDDFATFFRMGDFGMELDTIYWFRVVREGSKGS